MDIDRNSALYKACQHPGEDESVWQARYRLVSQMLDATTVEECRAAEAAADEWLKDHPHDPTVCSVAEQVASLLDYYGYYGAR